VSTPPYTGQPAKDEIFFDRLLLNAQVFFLFDFTNPLKTAIEFTKQSSVRNTRFSANIRKMLCINDFLFVYTQFYLSGLVIAVRLGSNRRTLAP
jgi:hypothetical protein